MKRKLFIIILIIVSSNLLYAQSERLDSLISANFTTFKKNTTDSFDGKGWEILLDEVNKNSSVLLGETHFTNEIPYFTNALIEEIRFDNYFLEVAPYTTKTIENKIKSLTEKELENYSNQYSSNYSFLAYISEFNLFKNIVKKKTNIYGIEQISLFSDRITISELFENSRNPKARAIYKEMLANSINLKKENKDRYYLFTKDCLENIDRVLSLKISDNEREQLEAMKLSRKIYANQDHHLRVQLLKNLVLKNSQKWSGQKNLFKFGAFHLPKGESLLEIYDIGNLVHNIEDANFRSSLHIMLIGKYENSDVDDIDKLFEKFVKDEQWYCFDLRPINNSISDNQLKIEDITLLRIIKGYDFLIYIPTLTGSEKLKSK